MRDVKIEFSFSWEESRISKKPDKEPGFYTGSTVSLLKDVPEEVSDKELLERWDKVSLTEMEEFRYSFRYSELLDAEIKAREELSDN